MYRDPIDATRVFGYQYLYDIYFDTVIGEGYYKGGEVYGTTDFIRVSINEKGQIITGYPKLPKRQKWDLIVHIEK